VIIPLVVILYKRRKRTKQLQDQLPGALDMLARAVRAGESLDQALEVVGAHSPEPLAAEFRTCARQLGMGLSIPGVMRSLVDRVQLYDVRIFTTTLIVHRQTGGNVARMLERLAKVIRDRLSYRRQLKVSTGAGRASALLVGLMGPVVFLFFFFCRPEYLNAMLETTLGQSMLIIAATLEIIGLIWTVRLMKPAY
jgi:tight adherence protein B